MESIIVSIIETCIHSLISSLSDIDLIGENKWLSKKQIEVYQMLIKNPQFARLLKKRDQQQRKTFKKVIHSLIFLAL